MGNFPLIPSLSPRSFECLSFLFRCEGIFLKMLTLLHCVCALVLFFIVQFSPLVCKRIFAIEYDLLHELVK